MSAPSTIPATPTPTEPTAPAPPAGKGPGRTVAIVLGVIVLAVLAFFGITRWGLGDDAGSGTTADVAPLELSLGDGGALASCLPFDVAILADMSPAFAATATAVEGETVTLSVDRWYTGGDADTVVLHAPAGLEALIGGVDFTVGQQYLVTASDGVVNYCGYTGPATPEMTAAFDEAFAG